MKGTKGEYELVILQPAHFLYGGFPVIIKHPITQEFAKFYASKYNDGLLHEGSSTGPPLPPFHSRGEINRSIPLNPILVNLAAMNRFDTVIYPGWGSTLDQHAITVLQEVVKLYKAVLWDPQNSNQKLFEIPNPQTPPSTLDIGDWPYPSKVPQPSSSSAGLCHDLVSFSLQILQVINELNDLTTIFSYLILSPTLLNHPLSYQRPKTT